MRAKITLLRILFILIWIGLFFASTDGWALTGGFSDKSLNKVNIFQIIYNEPFLLSNNNWITLFEILVVIFIVHLLALKSNTKIKQTSIKIVFFLSTFVFLLNLINPNNNVSFIYLFISKDIRHFYISILLMYSLAKITEEKRKDIILDFWRCGGIVIFIGSLFYFMLFTFGYGMIWLGRDVTITYGDTLRIIGIFHCLLLMLYLKTKNTNYILTAILLFVVMFFSFRRTILIVSIAFDFVALFIFYIQAPTKRLISTFSVISFILSISIYNFFSGVFEKYFGENFERILSAFNYIFRINSSNFILSDSGHLDESIYGTIFFFNEVNERFWGGGVGGNRINFGLVTEKIHNSFVNVWSIYGLHFTIYLVLLVFLLVYEIFRLRNEKKMLMRMQIKVLIILLIVVGWFAGGAITDNLQFMLIFILLYFLSQIPNLEYERNFNCFRKL